VIIVPGAYPTQARCRWLTPVILATQEAKIRRIVVQSQPESKKDPISKIPSTKMGMVKWLKWIECLPSKMKP
jgi:hypothetical protein